MDYVKLADIVCPVLSVADIDLMRFKTDPHAFGGAYDELGLTTISVLRAQGLGLTVPIIQDCHTLQGGKRKEVRDLFMLFLKSEFPESSRVISLEDPNDLVKLMLELKTVAPIVMDVRQDRGFMLAEGIQFSPDVWFV